MKQILIKKHSNVVKPIVIGFLSGILLLLVYISILAFFNTLPIAIEQFLSMKYWILAIVIGFSMQIGFFVYIKNFKKLENLKGVKTEIAATGTVSTISMVSCCMHHLSDIIPLLGLSVVSLFFDKYQTVFLIVGIISNVIGINHLLIIIQKNRLYEKNKALSRILVCNMKSLMNITIFFGIVFFVIVLLKSI